MQIKNNTLYRFEIFPHRFKESDHRLVLLAKATYTFNRDGTFELSDPQLDINHGDEVENTENGPITLIEADTAPFKPKTDIIVLANAYVPQGRQSSYTDVEVKVGSLERHFRVFGDRYWRKSSIIGELEKSDCVNFSWLPMTYQLAYGGRDAVGNCCLSNPVGKGYVSDQGKKTVEGVPLPNIEDPDKLIESWQDRPEPVGIGVMGKSWQPRIQYAGTYDEQWQTQRAPDPPDNFSFLFYNCAHPKMQLEDYLKGDETVRMINLTAEGKEEFSLPNLNPTASITMGEEIFPVPMNLDTLCIMAEERQFFLLWRGMFAIKDLTATEVDGIQLGL